MLRRGDFVLTESLAIPSYLDRAHPERPLFGATRAVRDDVVRWRSEGCPAPVSSERFELPGLVSAIAVDEIYDGILDAAGHSLLA